MTKIDGEFTLTEITPDYLKNQVGKKITGYACIHRFRKGSGFSFIDLRTGRYLFQAVYISEICSATLKNISEGSYIKFTGTVKEELRAAYGYEITLADFTVLSAPTAEFPVNITDNSEKSTPEAALDYRLLTIRNLRSRAILKITEGITDGFSDFMKNHNFTKIHSPQITLDNPLNSQNMFRLKYFGNDAVLSHNSIYARRAALAAYNRVYEISCAHRSDKHNSTRHLNEYMRLDFDIAYVTELSELMNIETAAIRHIIYYLNDNYAPELDLLGISLPSLSSVPSMEYREALSRLGKSPKQPSLDPTDEAKLSELAQAEYGSDFIFITHLPSAKQPFYAMECGSDCGLSETFVLLSGGREIAYGGLGIHDYTQQLKRLKVLEVAPEDMQAYLDLHRYGLPPYGEVGTGLERFTAGLLKLKNIKEAALFPCDMHHLTF